MTIDFSKFKPEDFLPNLGTTCPAVGDLQTGDLLFPRVRDAAADHFELLDNKNLGSDWLSQTATRWELSELSGGQKKRCELKWLKSCASKKPSCRMNS